MHARDGNSTDLFSLTDGLSIGVTGAAALIAAGSHVELPFYPVPMTLQTLAVLATGLALGLRAGGAAIAVCSSPQGYGRAAGLCRGQGRGRRADGADGRLSDRLSHSRCCSAVGRGIGDGRAGAVRRVCAITLLGAALIYPTGLLQLGTVVGWDKPVLEWGLYPVHRRRSGQGLCWPVSA